MRGRGWVREGCVLGCGGEGGCWAGEQQSVGGLGDGEERGRRALGRQERVEGRNARWGVLRLPRNLISGWRAAQRARVERMVLERRRRLMGGGGDGSETGRVELRGPGG